MKPRNVLDGLLICFINQIWFEMSNYDRNISSDIEVSYELAKKPMMFTSVWTSILGLGYLGHSAYHLRLSPNSLDFWYCWSTSTVDQPAHQINMLLQQCRVAHAEA